MQKVLIDKFIVPAESRLPLLETSRAIQDILKTLPGFVEGFVYEKRSGHGVHDIMTTVVWRDDEALENAKTAMGARLRELGLNPAEKMRSLNVRIERAVYDRRPF